MKDKLIDELQKQDPSLDDFDLSRKSLQELEALLMEKKQERNKILAEIQRQDPAYEDIDLSQKSIQQLESLLEYIESDPDNPYYQQED